MRPFLLLIGLLLGSCAAPAATEGRSFAWVWLLTGPKDAEVQGEARATAFAGHFANMGRLTAEGLLILAGPMAEPRARLDHRGVFIFDVPDMATAQAVASTDPAVQAGILVMEVEPFHTRAPLDEIPSRHKAFVAASGVPNPPFDFHCRPYVLLTGSPAAAAEGALADVSIPVLMRGRFTERDTALFCLDLAEAGPAQELVAALGGRGITWTVIPWYGTEEVAQLPSLRGP